jgi:hypothetical protein
MIPPLELMQFQLRLLIQNHLICLLGKISCKHKPLQFTMPADKILSERQERIFKGLPGVGTWLGSLGSAGASTF